MVIGGRDTGENIVDNASEQVAKKNPDEADFFTFNATVAGNLANTRNE